ncbi:hypothetical protein Q5H80_20410 [Vibrio sp. SNU_ST1]|uniref:hypothetical protein n=1 Tax=Vibrio sp. SNU_ST1 TaxID=3064001 RepID=UPI00272993C1|nr:hypothetical protein [Vibrio sp. SNU_ST1]WKY59920.1 hypothetical protein Q5H80_20410 [Vibrio sp. SNU_ST1]
MKKIVGLILLASLTACGGGGGGGGKTTGTVASKQTAQRTAIKLSSIDVKKLSAVEFSSAKITGFEAPSQSK